MARDLTIRISGDARGALGAFGQVEGGAGRLGNVLGGLGVAAAAAFAAIGAAAGAAAAEGVQRFAAFESGMNEVFTLLPGASQQAMGAMSRDVRDFALEMGTATTDVVPALYQALSAGVPQDTVFDFLEVANQAAMAGVSTLETAVDGITSTVNAYGADVINAGQASDLMFTAVRLGKTTFDELASSLFQVNPTAAALGVSFGDVTAALASMTAQGVPTSVATTQLRQMFVELGDAGTVAGEAFEGVAGKSLPDFLAAGGNTADVLALLQEAADDAGVPIQQMFGSVEAGNAALALAGANADAYRTNIAAMGDSAGATQAAYEQMDQGLGRAWERMKVAANEAFLQIGERLAPALSGLASWVQANMPAFQSAFTRALDTIGAVISDRIVPAFAQMRAWWDTNGPQIITTVQGMVAAIGEAFTGIAAWWTEHGPGITAAVQSVFGYMSEIFGRVREAAQPIIDALGGQLSPILAALAAVAGGAVVAAIGGMVASVVAAVGPILAIGAAIASLVGGLAHAWQNSETFRDVVTAVWTEIATIATEVWPQIQATITAVMDAIVGGVGVALTLLSGIWDLFGDDLIGAISAVWDGIRSLFSASLDVVQGLFETFAGLFSGDWGRMWDGIKQAFEGTWNTIRALLDTALGILRGAIGMFVDLVQLIWAGFVQGLQQAWEGLWNGIKSFFTTLWADIQGEVDTGVTYLRDRIWEPFAGAIASAWDGIWTGINNGFSVLWRPIENAVTAVIGSTEGGTGLLGIWGRFTDAITSVWDGMWSGIEAALKVGGSIYSGLDTAFDALATHLGTVWDGIKSALATPINWVIDNVFNDGIRRAWNAVAGLLPGMGEMDSIPRLAFATGGVVPGVGSSDTVPAMLTPGEIVITKDIAERNRDFLLAFNRGDPEALRAAGRPQYFSEGGEVGSIDRAKDFARAQVGKPYSWGGVGPAGYDCSGFLSAIQNVLEGKGPHARRFTSASIGSSGDGWVPGSTGIFTVGTRRGVGRGSGGHVAGTLDGLNVESAGSTGPRVGPGAWGSHHGYFNEIFSLSGGWIRDQAASLVNEILNPVRSMLSTWADGQGRIGDLLHGAGTAPMDALVTWIRNGNIPGLATGGIVTSPTLAMIGEGNGPEAVIPLSDPRADRWLSGGGSVHIAEGAVQVTGHSDASLEAYVNMRLEQLAEDIEQYRRAGVNV